MIEYVRMYDKNNVLLVEYGSFAKSPTGITYGLYPTPVNTYKVIYSINISGTSYVYSETSLGCSLNQYYYFNDNYVDTLYCSGKRENGIETTRETITNGKKVEIVQITVQEKITQNTGLKLNEKQLFDLGSSPYIFTISGTNVKNYILSDTTFQGFNTKTFGNRNTVLNLLSDKIEKRFTNNENNFFN